MLQNWFNNTDIIKKKFKKIIVLKNFLQKKMLPIVRCTQIYNDPVDFLKLCVKWLNNVKIFYYLIFKQKNIIKKIEQKLNNKKHLKTNSRIWFKIHSLT